MKRKPGIMSAVVLPIAAAACFFSVTTHAAEARVQPPPKPEVATIVEPGDAQRKQYHVAHRHHHKGHIKKDKSGNKGKPPAKK
jgi:hypothetical protein